LDIRDVCRYLVAVARYGKRGEIYNICRGKSCSIRYLLNKLIEISGVKDVNIVADREYNKETDLPDSFGSIKKLRGILKTVKFIPLEDSLRDSYLYYLPKG